MDCSEFLLLHPFPSTSSSSIGGSEPLASRRVTSTNLFRPFDFCCGKAEAELEEEYIESNWGWGAEGEGEAGGIQNQATAVSLISIRLVTTTDSLSQFEWTESLLLQFRLELEKIIILDYLSRNTDRSLDNLMMKFCSCSTPSSTQPLAQPLAQPLMSEINTSIPSIPSTPTELNDIYAIPHIHLAAIDNSLSFPHQHPGSGTGSWRSYPYGWLNFPLSVIGGPFATETREKYLPLLTSRTWWAETSFELRKEFQKDPGFNETMWRKQLSVIKGQGWNSEFFVGEGVVE